jgi:hypothetical protein
MTTSAEAALNRLCKWRTVLAGWHLGTKAAHEPGVAAMRDLQDFRLVVRAEVTALTALLIDKGVFTVAEYQAALAREAVELEQEMQRSFPGYRATDDGISITPDVAEETNRVRGFPW